MALRVSASTPKADIFVCLQCVHEDGSAAYVTEGCLRLMHRRCRNVEINEEQLDKKCFLKPSKRVPADLAEQRMPGASISACKASTIRDPLLDRREIDANTNNINKVTSGTSYHLPLDYLPVRTFFEEDSLNDGSASELELELEREEERIKYEKAGGDDEEEIWFELQPVSFMFKKNQRIRLAVYGADYPHFSPATKEPYSLRIRVDIAFSANDYDIVQKTDNSSLPEGTYYHEDCKTNEEYRIPNSFNNRFIVGSRLMLPKI